MNRISLSSIAICLALSISAYAKYDTLIVSGINNYWQTGTVTVVTGAATVTVNESQRYQKWLGFGGCFNEKGWEALSKLSSSERTRAIQLLFDKQNGIGITWGRIPIGASDYAIARYTLNQTTGDTLMNSFSITHDNSYLIPFIKAAQAVKPDIIFWASAWTPPTWMKTGAVDAAGYDGGAFRNQATYLMANALYTARFIEAYNANGIPIKAIFPQNEPGYTTHYPSCGWGKYALPPPEGGADVNGTEYLSDYVANYLWPTLQNRGLTSTDLWFGTLSNNNYASAYWSGAQSKAGTHIKGVGLQWNNVGLVATVANAGYLVMQSEHQCGNYPWKTVVTNVANADSTHFFASYAPNNYNYGLESWRLLTTWIRAGVNIYSAWNMVLDTGGFNLDQSRKWPQNALLTVNYQTATLKVTPVYYVFRHLAQYLDTGAVRLGTSGGDALAFRNPDSSIVTIVFNSATSPAALRISVRGTILQFVVPAQGWATLCVGLNPTTSIKNIYNNQFPIDKSGLRITCKGDGYRIELPSQETGRLELLTLSGRVLESRAIPKGSREIMLRKQTSHAGLLLVRVMYDGGNALTARLFNVR
jgi:glucosylceramidase